MVVYVVVVVGGCRLLGGSLVPLVSSEGGGSEGGREKERIGDQTRWKSAGLFFASARLPAFFSVLSGIFFFSFWFSG